MKLVIMLYLKEDDAVVAELLERHGVAVYSRLPLEGHGTGMPGWYGEVAPYSSSMVFTVLDAARAEELLEAVALCTGCRDPSHPIHALQVDVERMADSGSAAQ